MIIERSIYPDILAHLEKKEITVLVGPRQVGKTTMMNWLRSELDRKEIRYLWFNLDLERDFSLLESQERLLLQISLEFGSQPGVVFIDEIQRKQNAGLFLKGIYDTLPDIKFVISGSGSLELRENVIESLAGRKKIFYIRPLGFNEFLDFKTDYKYRGRHRLFMEAKPEVSDALLKEYLTYGGYPAVVLASTHDEKKNHLIEIVNSYLYRDIRVILNIQYVGAYHQLMRILAQQVAQPVKYTSLAQYLTVSANTVKDYIWYLNHTYIIESSIPYFTNPLKEIVKEPSIYFLDLGFLNLQRNDVALDVQGSSMGMVFQNFIHNYLKDSLGENISLKYWRTKDKAEVDIVIDHPKYPIPVEVKYHTLTEPKISRAYHNFIKIYRPAFGLIVSRGGEFEKKVEDTMVYFRTIISLRQTLVENF